jgi:hypothetical protein
MAAQYISARRSVIVKITGVSFVDDTGLGVSSDYQWDETETAEENNYQEIVAVVHPLATLAQHWGRLLFTTGGSINLQKSFWYLIAWRWKNGKPILATIPQAPLDISLTSGYNTDPTRLPRIESHSAFRTLGVYIYQLLDANRNKWMFFAYHPTLTVTNSKCPRCLCQRLIYPMLYTSDQNSPIRYHAHLSRRRNVTKYRRQLWRHSYPSCILTNTLQEQYCLQALSMEA